MIFLQPGGGLYLTAQTATGLAFIPHSIYYTISQHTTNRRY